MEAIIQTKQAIVQRASKAPDAELVEQMPNNASPTGKTMRYDLTYNHNSKLEESIFPQAKCCYLEVACLLGGQ